MKPSFADFALEGPYGIVGFLIFVCLAALMRWAFWRFNDASGNDVVPPRRIQVANRGDVTVFAKRKANSDTVLLKFKFPGATWYYHLGLSLIHI